MTAAVVGTDLDWVGALACTVVLIVAAVRAARAGTHLTADPWVGRRAPLAVIGTAVLTPGMVTGVPAGYTVTAAAVVVVGFLVLVICSARYQERRVRRLRRTWAADTAPGVGAASGIGGGR